MLYYPHLKQKQPNATSHYFDTMEIMSHYVLIDEYCDPNTLKNDDHAVAANSPTSRHEFAANVANKYHTSVCKTNKQMQQIL